RQLQLAGALPFVAIECRALKVPLPLTPINQLARSTINQPASQHVRAAAGASKRRAPAEVSAVGERLYQAVCAHPGESMATLAKELEMAPRELQRPMALLREAGRVRCVGQRHLMRYFPRTGASS